MSQPLRYYCSPAIVWVKDADQTLVVDRATGQSWSMRGTEAVVWELLTVGHSRSRAAQLLSLILSVPARGGRHTLADVVQRWRDANLIEVCEEAVGGKP